MDSAEEHLAKVRKVAKGRALHLLGRAEDELNEVQRILELAGEPMAAATCRLSAWSARQVRQRIVIGRTELG